MKEPNRIKKASVSAELEEMKGLCKIYVDRIEFLERENTTQREYIKHVLETLEHFKKMSDEPTHVRDRINSRMPA